MTHIALARAVAPCTVIDEPDGVTIDAPDGYCFGPGLHALMTFDQLDENHGKPLSWYRDRALEDFRQHTLTPCEPGCPCRED